MSVDPPASRAALVTGGTRGIGRHLAEGLAADGCAVVLLGTDPGRAGQVAGEISRLTGSDRVSGLGCDVTDEDAVRAAVSRARELLCVPVDLLVNGAGVIEAREAPPWGSDLADMRHVLNVNVFGVMVMIDAVVPAMIEAGGGRVLNLNSGAACRDAPQNTAYHASKAALFRIGGALHAAGHEHGLRVLELAPGVVRTDMTLSMKMFEGRSEWTDPADVVELALAFAHGLLDPWSGRMVRAGVDAVEDLLERAAAGLSPAARTLGLLGFGEGDPLS